MMSMIYLVAISVEILRIDRGLSLEKKFTKLIYDNPCMILYLAINHVDSCHSCVCGLLT